MNHKISHALISMALSLVGTSAFAEARQVSEYHWDGVDRVIAVGDVHGDYDQFLKVLREAGLINKKGRWEGGETHLVQTGDVPDRGPDTRRILDFLEDLQKQAKKKGGRVHTLIGNHDAMNVYGDLRYVTAEEFAAFEGRNSEKFRELQWEHQLKTLEARDPEGFSELDQAAYRKEWEKNVPLGWVEHRQAWSPSGDYGAQVLGNPAVLKVNDTLFMHGGMSAKYCADSLEALNQRVQERLENFDYADGGIIDDEFGPLWYRGLATESETELSPMLDAVLERYQAKRIVVGHTPTQGVVWPRFDGKVILNDTGMAAYYGGHLAFLELTSEGATARYANGVTLPVPTHNDQRIDYLKAVVALDPANAHLQSRLQKMLKAQARRKSDRQDGGDSQGQHETASSEAVAAMSEEEAALARARAAAINPDICQ